MWYNNNTNRAIGKEGTKIYFKFKKIGKLRHVKWQQTPNFLQDSQSKAP